MTRSLRPSSLGPSLLFATGAIGITAAAVFAAGMVVLPEEGGSQALLVLSGDDNGRYELNQLSVGEWNEGSSPEGPLKLSLTFRSKQRHAAHHCQRDGRRHSDHGRGSIYNRQRCRRRL